MNFFGLYIPIPYWNRIIPYGIYIISGAFGSGKTQAIVKYLKSANRKKFVNVANFYSGYNDFQLQSHKDITAFLWDLYEYYAFVRQVPSIKRLYTYKMHLASQWETAYQAFLDKHGITHQQAQLINHYLRFNIVLDE